jgi:hypothetical protein
MPPSADIRPLTSVYPSSSVFDIAEEIGFWVPLGCLSKIQILRAIPYIADRSAVASAVGTSVILDCLQLIALKGGS